MTEISPRGGGTRLAVGDWFKTKIRSVGIAVLKESGSIDYSIGKVYGLQGEHRADNPLDLWAEVFTSRPR